MLVSCQTSADREAPLSPNKSTSSESRANRVRFRGTVMGTETGIFRYLTVAEARRLINVCDHFRNWCSAAHANRSPLWPASAVSRVGFQPERWNGAYTHTQGRWTRKGISRHPD